MVNTDYESNDELEFSKIVGFGIIPVSGGRILQSISIIPRVYTGFEGSQDVLCHIITTKILMIIINTRFLHQFPGRPLVKLFQMVDINEILHFSLLTHISHSYYHVEISPNLSL